MVFTKESKLIEKRDEIGITPFFNRLKKQGVPQGRKSLERKVIYLQIKEEFEKLQV